MVRSFTGQLFPKLGIWLTVLCIVNGFACYRAICAQSAASLDVSDIVAENADAAVAISVGDDTSQIELSGVLVDESGIVLTVAHGIRDTGTVYIHLRNGLVRSGRPITVDSPRDIALVQIESPESLPYAVAGDATELKPGDQLVVIGAPLGLRWSVSQGIVSSTERMHGGQRLIQTDAGISPGSSGAPVFDTHGLLVALVKGRISVADSGQTGELLNFLIPINTSFPLLDRHGISSHSKRLVRRGLHATDLQERLRLLQSAVRSDPDNAEAHFYLGVAYGDASDTAKQLTSFETFARLRPESFQAHRNLAIAYLRVNKNEQALEHLLIAARLRPDSARVHNDLGETYRRMNMYQKSRDELEKAVHLDPMLAEAHFNLGLLLVTSFDEAADAAKHLQRYLDLRPSTPDAEDVRRWLEDQRTDRSLSRIIGSKENTHGK